MWGRFPPVLSTQKLPPPSGWKLKVHQTYGQKNEKKKKNEMRIFESYQVGTDASFYYHLCDEGVRGIRGQ